jgi:hypothetical protein
MLAVSGVRRPSDLPGKGKHEHTSCELQTFEMSVKVRAYPVG